MAYNSTSLDTLEVTAKKMYADIAAELEKIMPQKYKTKEGLFFKYPANEVPAEFTYKKKSSKYFYINYSKGETYILSQLYDMITSNKQNCLVPLFIYVFFNMYGEWGHDYINNKRVYIGNSFVFLNPKITKILKTEARASMNRNNCGFHHYRSIPQIPVSTEEESKIASLIPARITEEIDAKTIAETILFTIDSYLDLYQFMHIVPNEEFLNKMNPYYRGELNELPF